MHRATLLIPENFAVADQTRDPLKKGENVKESFSHSFRKPFHPEKDRGKQLFPLERWTEVDFERQCARDHVTGGIFSVLLDFILWPCLGWICFDWNGSYHFGFWAQRFKIRHCQHPNRLPKKAESSHSKRRYPAQAGPIRLFLESSHFVWVLLHFKQWVWGWRKSLSQHSGYGVKSAGGAKTRQQCGVQTPGEKV